MAERKPSREEVALIELGQTTIGRPSAVTLVVALLVTIVVVPLVQHGCELAEGEAPQAWSVFTRAPSERSFAEYERELEDASVFGHAILPAMQGVLVHLGVGNEKAYIGRDGWLFYRPGFDYVTGRGFLEPDVLRARRLGGKSWERAPQPDPMPAILAFRDQLAERGIELVLMPTTVKPQLDPTNRTDGPRPLQNPSYERWLAQVRAAGVRVYDPGPLLAGLERPFLKTDTHWTATAMRAVAAQLADEVRALLPPGTDAGYRSAPRSHSALGDIAVMLRLPDGQRTFAEEQVELEAVSQANGTAWQPERDADVLLLGDSFSNIYSLESMGWGVQAGLAETLALQLQRPIDRITINDGGAVQTRRALADELRRGDDRLAGKRLVIWQFAGRELAVGDWQVLDLADAPATAKQPRAPVEVRARITSVATPPQPRTVPYKDCVIGVRLAVTAAVAGTWPATEERDAVLLYVVGMRDNVWTDAARWQPGDDVDLRLVPWEQAPESVRSLNRRELDDDDLMLANPWFAELR